MIKLLYYILGKSKSISSTDVGLSEPVDCLRKTILTERAVVLAGLDPDQLTLWKVNIDLNEVSMNSLNEIKLENAMGVVKLEEWKQVSNYWPESDPPLIEHLHVIVEICATISSSNSDSSLHLDNKWARREDTARIIYQVLDKERLVLVRGTPGSGKTTLLKLLRNLILKEEEGAKVHVISYWFDIDQKLESQYKDRLTSRVLGLLDQSYEIASKTFILFDNGQDTYWDEQLWEIFFKDHQQRPNGYRIILFSSYGSPTKRPVKYAHGTPPLMPPRAHISLQRQNHFSIGQPVGLLLTRNEFDDVVKHADKAILDSHLQDFIFESTDGHVGAVICILEVLSFQFVTKQRQRIPLTMEDFQAMDKANLWRELGTRSAFGRGLPEREELAEVPMANFFKKLLVDGFVLSDCKVKDKTLNTCYKSGWVQADLGKVGNDSDDEDETEPVRYTFPSSLHRSYVSWRLMPSTNEIPYETVLQLAIAVIKKFNPSQLPGPERRVGGLYTDHPPEAQYQQEFYRAFFDVVGPAYTSPEYGTERGSRKGRIDIFIRSKKWGIELLRDGSNLQEHSSSRFGAKGAYGFWIPTRKMEDYLILDFRSNRPQVAHPKIPKLYHVVFEDEYRIFKILDGNLRTVHSDGLLQTWV